MYASIKITAYTWLLFAHKRNKLSNSLNLQVGCTNWKKVLLYLSGKLKQSVAEEIEAGHWWKIPGSFANDPVNLEHMNFWSLNRTERLKRLETHTKGGVKNESVILFLKPQTKPNLSCEM